MENIERLTELQKTIGYVPGFLSPVAVLGLMGECGEVAEHFVASANLSSLDQTDTLSIGEVYGRESVLTTMFVTTAKQLDGIKKQIRNSQLLATRYSFAVADDEAFDEELADLFYYVNAVAIGLGLTIDDLARTGYAKVMRKREAIGPEQTGK